ncbi:tRNA (adenosine(37)-N6)-threonylcarbamoyltransferase complex dimerization subunit type 1 TsaB [Aquirufa sp.]|uniref:tRNA (adenosine(37)-N6)-threonylcarbamoyltransferase complex dimerization subunit type 1 TsaB n=1 Tax=Aquirufa sp. TaxID=2676249 RepID=UPI0037C026AC
MSLIVSIETSTPLCSVALHQSGELLCTLETMEEGGHGKRLTRLIEAVCKESGISLEQLDAIAVSNGPGSYTGLRIGLATAKGLCFALDIPLITLNTLKIMANAWIDIPSSTFLLPMMDARRMEVYAAVFEGASHENFVETQAIVLEPNSFLNLTQPTIAFGNGALKWKDSCENKWVTFSEEHPYPHAKFMGKDAAVAYKKQNFASLVQAEPEYLKEFMGTKPKSKAL